MKYFSIGDRVQYKHHISLDWETGVISDVYIKRYNGGEVQEGLSYYRIEFDNGGSYAVFFTAAHRLYGGMLRPVDDSPSQPLPEGEPE